MSMVPLSEVVTLDRKGVHPSEVSPETPYIGLEHIERGGRILPHPQVGDIDLKSSKFYFFPEHILYGKLRPNLGKISRPDFAGICSTDILPLRPHAELDRGYLAHYLSQPEMIRYATSRTTGVNLPRLSHSSLAKFPIPLPPLGEQRRIAAILDQADAILAKRRVVVDQVDALARSIFLDMFGDPDSAAKVISFGKVAKLEGGRNVVASDPNVESKHRVIKISAVTTGIFRPQESKPLPANYDPPSNHFVRRGDLLMSRANTTELVGAVAYVQQTPKNLVLPDKVWKFQWLCKGSVPEFYYALFRSRSIRNKISRLSSGTSGSMKNVSKAKLSSMLIPDISLAEQEEFARRSKSVSAQRAVAQQALDRDNELFASLQSRAFRGEL